MKKYWYPLPPLFIISGLVYVTPPVRLGSPKYFFNQGKTLSQIKLTGHII
jgi:hypothetical protein